VDISRSSSYFREESWPFSSALSSFRPFPKSAVRVIPQKRKRSSDHAALRKYRLSCHAWESDRGTIVDSIKVGACDFTDGTRATCSLHHRGEKPPLEFVGTGRESRAPETARRKRSARRLARKCRGYVRPTGFFRDRGIRDGEISAAALRAFRHFPHAAKRNESGKRGREGRNPSGPSTIDES